MSILRLNAHISLKKLFYPAISCSGDCNTVPRSKEAQFSLEATRGLSVELGFLDLDLFNSKKSLT